MQICQQHSRGKAGFLWAAPVPSDGNVERQFDRVEIGKANIFDDAWVPWYTMHKLIAGLVDVYNATGYNTAQDVGSALGDWVFNAVRSSPVNRHMLPILSPTQDLTYLTWYPSENF